MDTTFLWHALSAGSMTLLGFLLLANVPHANRFPNRWLGLFFLCLAAIFVQLLLENSGASGRSLFGLIPVLELTRWATFPCFFIALKYFVDPTTSMRAVVWHFIPFVLFCVYSASVLFPVAYGGGTVALILPTWAIWVVRHVFLFQAILYWAASFWLLYRHQRQIRQFSAHIEPISLTWIRWVLVAVMVMTVLWLLGKNNPVITGFVPAGYFILSLVIAYHAVGQQTIYPVSQQQLPDLIEAIKTPANNYDRLTGEQVRILQAEVQRLVTEERLYLDPMLNLPLLSERVGIGTHELSFVLNQGFGKNFYQFVNEYRVKEAIRLLESREFGDQDMASVAIHAGFNSKTTFYAAFKRSTGMTPKAYLMQSPKPRAH